MTAIMTWFRTLPRLVRFEAIGFGCIVVLLAFDEYVDLPEILFGDEATPLRHHEFLIESAAVCGVAVMVVGLSWFADRRLRRLDSLLVMCSWCRQVRVNDRWLSLDAFLKEQDAVTTTYGLCPACYTKEASRRAPAAAATIALPKETADGSARK
jgi:hypothetical protein